MTATGIQKNGKFTAKRERVWQRPLGPPDLVAGGAGGSKYEFQNTDAQKWLLGGLNQVNNGP